MKLIMIFLLTTQVVYANSLSGEIKLKGKQPKGVLYIFAKKFNSNMPMPLAVKRIKDPSFPLKFTLDASNKMMKNIPFKGPFKITARLSPNGSAMDKSGIEVSTTKSIKLGEKDIILILDNSKKGK